jgi:predicted esterase
MSWLLVAFLGFLTPSCTAQLGGGAARSVPEADGRGPAQQADERIAHEDDGPFEALMISNFLPAVVFAPDSPGPHPLVVAAHGAGGVPEWECDYWRRLTQGRAFLLCLRGERTNNLRPSGYYYRTHLALEEELVAAMAAFERRFPQAPSGAALYAGFSQGAIMGAPMIVAHGREFPYLALLEGGYEYWSLAKARHFAAAGGKRVLFVCGTQWCADKSKMPAEWLQQANVAVRIEYAAGAGHTPSGEVMARTRDALPWLTAGDPVWE